MQLADVRRDVHGFHIARAQAEVAVHAGSEASPFAADAREWPLAVASESLALVQQDLASATGRRALRLKRLSEALQKNVARARSGESLEAWRQTLPGSEHRPRVPLHSVLDTLAHTDDRTRRQSMQAAASTSCEPLWSGWARQIEAAAGLDLSAMADDARTMLAETRDMYADVLAWWLARSTQLKPFPRGAEAHDVLWALRSLPFDALARPGEVRSLADTFRAIGLEPRWQLDAEARPGRWPGARVRVGREVLVSHRARGGFDDVRAALRSIGTALHRAGCDPEAPPEDRLLGDPTIAAATGEVWAGLVLDAAWAKRRFELDDPDHRRVLALADLADARVAAALVVVTREALARGASQALASEAGEQLSSALLGHWPAGAAPLVLPDPFEATTSMSARRLGARLLEHLRERCNEDWWANPRAGAVLNEIFRPGGLYAPDELAGQVGLSPFRGWTSLWADALG